MAIILQLSKGFCLKCQVCQVDSGADHLQQDPSAVLPEGVPPVIADLLSSYADVFATKVVFPPRSCSHTIPLIQGYRLVRIRPYKYAPTLKDEIER
jgi:hypothetical protein